MKSIPGYSTAYILFALLSVGLATSLPAATVQSTRDCSSLIPDQILGGANDDHNGDEKPRKVALEQNAPNPFSDMTSIRYGLPLPSYVRLTVYTMIGNPVAVLVDGRQDAGRYVVEFSAMDIPSGVYLYRLQTEQGSITGRMTVSRQ